MIDIHTAPGLRDFFAAGCQHRFGVMIAMHVEERHVKDRDQKFEIIKRQVAAGEDQVDIGKTFFGFDTIQFTLDSIANRQNFHVDSTRPYYIRKYFSLLNTR